MGSLVRRLTLSSGQLISSVVGRKVLESSGTASGTPRLSESGFRFVTARFFPPISLANGDVALVSHGTTSGT